MDDTEFMEEESTEDMSVDIHDFDDAEESRATLRDVDWNVSSVARYSFGLD